MSFEFTFIGGTGRGYKLIEALLEKSYLPKFAILMKEDDHEADIYSDKISELLTKNKIENSIKKKLSDLDYRVIKESKLDFIIVFGWRTLIDIEVNQSLKFGSIAVHYSLLPKYRGFAPLQWAMINGETETGVTLFLINEGEIDSGKIISQKKVQILHEDYAADLDNKLTDSSIELILKFFEDYCNNSLTLTEQDDSLATYTCKRIPEDGKIDWFNSSKEIYNFIRALAHPFTGAFCYFNDIRYHIRKASLVLNKKTYTGVIPGRIVGLHKNGIEVLSKDGTLLITEWENKITGKISNPADLVKSISTTLN